MSIGGKENPESARIIARNRRASHDYVLEETLVCGISLLGSEVKALRNSQVSFEEAYARIDGGEVWLLNLHIPEYQGASYMNHEPRRARKLLVKKRELAKLITRVEQKGKTLVPLRIMFNTRGLVKVEIAVGMGKQAHDKRESIHKREAQRDMDRQMGRRR